MDTEKVDIESFKVPADIVVYEPVQLLQKQQQRWRLKHISTGLKTKTIRQTHKNNYLKGDLSQSDL